jgi:hypothetical protein
MSQGLVTRSEDFAQYAVFEKYIDVVPAMNRIEHQELQKFTIYVYFTTEEYAIRGTDLIHGIKSHASAPSTAYAYGNAVPRCTICKMTGHLAARCKRYGLRMTFKQLCNVTLRAHLTKTLGCKKITVGSNGGREANWAYIWFESDKTRNNAVDAIVELMSEGTIVGHPLECDRPLPECWRCGKLHTVREFHDGDSCPDRKQRSQEQIYRGNQETPKRKALSGKIYEGVKFFEAKDPRSGISRNQAKKMQLSEACSMNPPNPYP